MTIGKRKGSAAKGAGGTGTNNVNKVGGSLSKNDHWYLQQAFGLTGDPGIAPVPAGSSGTPLGHTATGGVIGDWVDPSPGNVYRSHVFTASGEFVITALSPSYPADCEYLVVAGGGSGGYEGGGGGGGLRTNLSGHPRSTPGNPAFPVSATTYPISVGAGGGGQEAWDAAGGGGPGNPGTPSYIGPAPSKLVEATGGGTGGWAPTVPASPGGSGGGAASTPAPGSGTGIAPPTYTEGYSGGIAGPALGGGGGGTGGAGVAGASGGHGGIGTQVLIAGPSTSAGAGSPGPGGPGTEMGWFGGGGGGAPSTPAPTAPVRGTQGGGGPTGTGTAAPFAGGGSGRYGGSNTTNPLVNPAAPDARKRAGFSGIPGTGGGGGGVWDAGNSPYIGSGGGGTVIIRYQIGTGAPNMQCTGGVASLWPVADGSPSPTGSWIHVFNNSGVLEAPATFEEDVEYAIVAGGGGGGGVHPTTGQAGGGGGAGGYLTATLSGLSGPFSAAVTIGGGGQAGQATPGGSGETAGTNGGDSSVAFPTGTITSFGGGGGGGGGWGSSATGNWGFNPNTPSGAVTPYGLPHPYGLTQGNKGGNVGPTNPGAYGGGGGGAGGVGAEGSPGAAGGIGVQLPTTFRNPVLQSNDTDGGGGLGTPGAGEPTTPGHYWVAGGGGGGSPTANPSPKVWNAGGGGQLNPTPNSVHNGISNSGGGGSSRYNPGSPPTAPSSSGYGGSGIVVIAYPA